jgi:hypothetical protein
MDYEPIPDDLTERVRLLESILVASCQGSNPGQSHSYVELRQVFMSDSTLKPLLPEFVRTCRDLGHFWLSLLKKSHRPRHRVVDDERDRRYSAIE